MTSVFGLHTCFRQKKRRETLACGVIPAVLSFCLSPFGLTDRPNRWQLEVLLRLKQQSNTAFSFLDDQDPAHPYYVFLKSWGESALAAEYARQQRLQAERAEARRRRERERREEEEREAAAAKGPSVWWCALSVERGGPLACLSMRCGAMRCNAVQCGVIHRGGVSSVALSLDRSGESCELASRPSPFLHFRYVLMS